MAVLETIRVKFGIIITVLIAVALLSFLVDPTVIQQLFGSSQDEQVIGVINGEEVGVLEFQNRITELTNLNGSSMDENQQKMLREEVWNSIVQEKLFVSNAQKAGIAVGDAEMNMVMTGEIPSQTIMSNFADPQTGVISQDFLYQFIEMCETNDFYMAYWNYLSNIARVERYQVKYNSVLANSAYTNSLMLEKQLAEQNSTFDVDFVVLPYETKKDSSIVVSDNEMKAYYDSHKKLYKQIESRDIKYVSFIPVASEADITAITAEMNQAYAELSTTEDVQSFINRNSDRTFDGKWYKSGELNSELTEINDFVFGNKNGSTSEIIKKNDALYAVRIVDQQMLPESIEVKMLSVSSPDSLFAQVQSQTITTQNPEYQYLATAKVGTDVNLGQIKYRIVNTAESKLMKQVAILKKNIEPSQETIDSYKEKAHTFYSAASKGYDSFEQAVKESGLYARTVTQMLESAENIHNLTNTREITRWAFDSSEGNVSEVMTVNAKDFVVAVVTKVSKEGYTPFSEVSSDIEDVIYKEKLSQKKFAEVTKQIAGVESLKLISDMLKVEVSSEKEVAFSSNLDAKFIGAASAVEPNKVKVVAGDNGIYVFNVTNKGTDELFNEDDIKNTNMQNSYYLSSMALEEVADIKDYRARYF